MGRAKAERILKTIEKGINQLNPGTFIQISSDGPNVNLRFFERFSEKKESEELASLMQIGTCGLRTIHGSMKAGVKNSNWNIGKILKAAWKLLDEAPAQRELFEKVTETCIYPLPYCGHCWCEFENCACCWGADMAGSKEICCLLERSTKIKAATKFIISNTSSGS